MSLYNDPISDMLTRIRNASAIKRDKISLPHSRLKEALGQVLAREGFLAAVESTEEDGKPQLVLKLNYDRDGKMEPAIRGLERVSRPGQRIYVASKNIRTIQQGLGMSVVSTPKGLLTDSEARKQGVGGEIICKVW